MTHSSLSFPEPQIALLEINRPPVNALSRTLLSELATHVDKVRQNPDVKALVIAGSGTTFVCGADIAELDQPVTGNDLFNPLMNALENLTIPVVCSIHGMALGGGLELAMACHYRVAHADSKVGLPEVLLGVLPGAGGTQRLPRLVGARIALEMISTGKHVPALLAHKQGLIDELTHDTPCAAGIAYAQQLLERCAGPRPTRARAVDASTLPQNELDQALAAAEKKPGYPAAAAIVRCIQAALEAPFTEGQAIEQQEFERCRASSTSAALRHLFFAERNSAKIPGLPAGLALRPVRKVGIVGAGTMGRGIIMNFLSAGIASVLVETSQAALDNGVAQIKATYESHVAKGRMTGTEMAQTLDHLQPSLNYQDLADCDLVIEAVFENMDIKKTVCRQLGQICKQGAILATNTSTLNVDELAQASGRPADFLGLHFFSPANIMKLLEVVRGKLTAPDVLATAMKLARTIRKTPVVSGVCYGFIGNRMLESYLREADFLLLEGASPKQIDTAIESMGLAMGPCRMLDMAGTDVAAKIVIEQEKAGLLPADPSYRAVICALFEAGRNGQKVSRGYYRYDGRTPVDDPDVETISHQLAEHFGIQRRNDISDQEIIERCLYPLINEGARILEEGIAYRPGDIDIVWTRGYGFPDFRGGPIFMADQIGLKTIIGRMSHYAATRGNAYGYWTPSELLKTRADQGQRLSD